MAKTYTVTVDNAPAPTAEAYRILAAEVSLLLLGLYLNKKIEQYLPGPWILLSLFVAAALAPARFTDEEKPAVRLWQLVGLCSAIYALFHYPLMPPASGSSAAVALYALLLALWLAATAAGVLCFRVPSLAVLPAAYLVWSNAMAQYVTGLPTTVRVDIQPLPEVSACLAAGFLVLRLRRWWSSRKSPGSAVNAAANLADTYFASLFLLMAIALHLANYFWAFYTKMTLDGPWGAWLKENNPAYIYLAALDDGHILHSAYPHLVAATYHLLDSSHLYANALVLALQGAAILAFFLTRRAFVILLLLFDAMHVSIIWIVGANFWPWILLNVAITLVVAKTNLRLAPLFTRAAGTVFILIAPHFAQVAMLGWYDSGANNKLYFEALDDAGQRHTVPSNFFTFYSYSFGHMDYGSPDPASAFNVGSPNGGVMQYRLFRAGRSCDTAELLRSDPGAWTTGGQLSSFVANYQHLALLISSKAGSFPYDFYPHHFFVPPSESRDFAALDKKRIVAYIYRRESVCLSFENGALNRRVVSSAEYKIEIAQKDRYSATAPAGAAP